MNEYDFLPGKQNVKCAVLTSFSQLSHVTHSLNNLQLEVRFHVRKTRWSSGESGECFSDYFTNSLIHNYSLIWVKLEHILWRHCVPPSVIYRVP